MGSIRIFLEEVLHLRINEQKSAVARPWERKFLGYSVSVHRETRLRIAPERARRLAGKVRELMRAGRGRSLARTIQTLNPVLRGWISYFRLAQSKGMLGDLDGWVRRRLRCLLWRQWRRRRTRRQRLLSLGLPPERAKASSLNGRGPWWNAGASHMNHALPAGYFARMGLISLLDTQRRLQGAR